MISNSYLSTALFTTLVCYSLSYPLSGKVIDEKNTPVEGVTVTASRAGQHVITKSDGSFEFSTAAANHRENNYQMIPFSFNNRHVKVSISTPSIVNISLYNLRGCLISTMYQQRLNAGTHEISCNPYSYSRSISILRITIGRESFVVKTCNIGNAKIIETTLKPDFTGITVQRSATDSDTFPDTLIFDKIGYIPKRVPVKTRTDELGNIRLYDTTFTLNPGNFPKLDGSTTNVPLARIICCKMFNSTYKWRENRSALSNSYWETVPDSSNSDLYNKIMTLTLFSKTPQSYDSLIAGKRELILVASAPSARHYEAAAAAGLTFDIRPFAVDALLMVVNKDCKVSGITTQNIKDMYTKAVTNWKQVGGQDSIPIDAYKREETSGSQELMKTLIMKDTPIEPSIPILIGMMSVYEALHFGTRAISYTPYYYKEFQMRDTLIRSLTIDGIKPERNSLYKRTYPHCAEVLVVSLTSLSDTSQAAKLRDWLLAPQGQRVVVESGYVPIREPDNK